MTTTADGGYWRVPFVRKWNTRVAHLCTSMQELVPGHSVGPQAASFSEPVHEHTTMTEHKKSLQALFVLQTFLISLMRDPVLTFYAHNTTHA